MNTEDIDGSLERIEMALTSDGKVGIGDTLAQIHWILSRLLDLMCLLNADKLSLHESGIAELRRRVAEFHDLPIVKP